MKELKATIGCIVLCVLCLIWGRWLDEWFLTSGFDETLRGFVHDFVTLLFLSISGAALLLIGLGFIQYMERQLRN